MIKKEKGQRPNINDTDQFNCKETAYLLDMEYHKLQKITEAGLIRVHFKRTTARVRPPKYYLGKDILFYWDHPQGY